MVQGAVVACLISQRLWDLEPLCDEHTVNGVARREWETGGFFSCEL